MNKQVIVVAPHPDDETLGCGGTILRHIAEGDKVHWLIVTCLDDSTGFKKQEEEIKNVAVQYGFSSVHQLGFTPATLDAVPLKSLVNETGKVFRQICPEQIYLPFNGDAHTDHRIVANAVMACTKWFRYNFVRRILAYETLSETEFGDGFKPNVFVDITEYLDKKIEIFSAYKSQTGKFPFPRSEEAVRSLAAMRGAASGFKAAESFILIKEIL